MLPSRPSPAVLGMGLKYIPASNVFAGNMLPANYGLSGPELFCSLIGLHFHYSYATAMSPGPFHFVQTESMFLNGPLKRDSLSYFFHCKKKCTFGCINLQLISALIKSENLLTM
jgi:hypothetical protein